MRLKFIYFLPAIIWFFISVFLLLMPGSDIPDSRFFELVYFDKWVHIGMFALLTFFWIFPFLYANRGSIILYCFITAFWILFGILIEFIQYYFASERSFDLFDIMADAFGCLMALTVIVVKGKKIIQLGEKWFK